MQGVGMLWALMQQQYWSLYAHNVNVGRLSCIIIGELGLPEADKSQICTAASIHDLGKLFISRSILEKPTFLDAADWVHVRRHPRLGAMAVAQMDGLRELDSLVRFHHECWDGSGYEGLKGEDIPLGSRIIAIADAIAAMTEPRSYRKMASFGDVITELIRGKGKQFDPLLVDLALDCRSRLADLVEQQIQRETPPASANS